MYTPYYAYEHTCELIHVHARAHTTLKTTVQLNQFAHIQDHHLDPGGDPAQLHHGAHDIHARSKGGI